MSYAFFNAIFFFFSLRLYNLFVIAVDAVDNVDVASIVKLVVNQLMVIRATLMMMEGIKIVKKRKTFFCHSFDMPITPSSNI